MLHSMAVTNRFNDMEELFQSMQTESGKGTKPGVLSYDAILLARIRARSWNGAIALCEEMKAEGLVPSAHTVQGLLLAKNQTGGSPAVASTLESLLQSGGQFDETAFRLACRMLLGGAADGNLEELRQNIRGFGEESPATMREPALNLARSIRSAEIEDDRRPNTTTGQASEHETKRKQKEAWQKATSHLLEFVNKRRKTEEITSGSRNEI